MTPAATRPAGPTPIVAFEIEGRDLPLRAPLVTARGPIATRRVFIVRLRDADGATGVGEAPPLPQAGTESASDCEKALARLRTGLLAGQPLEATGAPAARFGLDLALWDLLARRTGVPLARALCTTPMRRVPVNGLLTGPTESLAEAAVQAETEGFSVLKLKVGGRPLDEDVARLDAVRRATSVALRLDANGAWATVDEASAALQTLGLERVEAVEQPLPPGDLAGAAALRAQLAVPLAADESIVDEATGLAIVRRGAADRLVLKPARMGSLAGCLRVASAARAAGLEVVVTTTLDGAIARAGALHLAAAIHRPGGPVHGLATGGLLAADLADGHLPSEGFLAIDPTRSGHGVQA
jgi:L-Ala-D/L-Glu epimerase